LGQVPENPDTYYHQLRQGKNKFDLLCSEYQQLYEKGEWWGFYQLWQDWGERRWVLKYLCSWYKGNLPDFTKEQLDIE